jgi:arylamine N-acetyltransferase
LFKHVLAALGFDAAALAARRLERPADEVRARSHMVLLVALGSAATFATWASAA